jgi:hypothetical protein
MASSAPRLCRGHALDPATILGARGAEQVAVTAARRRDSFTGVGNEPKPAKSASNKQGLSADRPLELDTSAWAFQTVACRQFGASWHRPLVAAAGDGRFSCRLTAGHALDPVVNGPQTEPHGLVCGPSHLRRLDRRPAISDNEYLSSHHSKRMERFIGSFRKRVTLGTNLPNCSAADERPAFDMARCRAVRGSAHG